MTNAMVDQVDQQKVRDFAMAKLMLEWGRTIAEHRIGDFDTWLEKELTRAARSA